MGGGGWKGEREIKRERERERGRSRSRSRRKWEMNPCGAISINLLKKLEPGTGVLTLKKVAVLEKYLTVSAFFSTACGLTISNPCKGVKATEEAVPATWRLTVVVPPYACWRCRFRCSVLEMRTLVFSSTVGPRILPGPTLPIIPRV